MDYYYGGSDSSGNVLNNGNIIHQTISVPNDAGAYVLQLTQIYTYDALNRLSAAEEVGVWKQSFHYDRFGNRTFDAVNTTAGMVSSSLAIDPATNRFEKPQGLIDYDKAGNLIKDFQGHSLEYDAENRLVNYDGGAAAGGESYTYDGDGKRVKKVQGTGLAKTVFVYNAVGQLIVEYANFAQTTNGGTSYLTADSLGTPRIITDASGEVRARHDYLPFGEELGLTGGRSEDQKYLVDNIRQKFAGLERDDTGLDYSRARYYASKEARFTSVDPLTGSAKAEMPQSWNRYSYCINNPLVLIDPSGLDWYIKDDIHVKWFEGEPEPGYIRMPSLVYYGGPEHGWVRLDMYGSGWREGYDSMEDAYAAGQSFTDMLRGFRNQIRKTWNWSYIKNDFKRFVDDPLGRGGLGDPAFVMLGAPGPLTVFQSAGGGITLATSIGEKAPMSIVRIIAKGENLQSVIDEGKRYTLIMQREYALVTLSTGERALVSGGPGGITFAPGQIQRLFGHSHPWGTGPTPEDFEAIRALGQRSSWIFERGMRYKFGGDGNRIISEKGP